MMSYDMIVHHIILYYIILYHVIVYYPLCEAEDSARGAKRKAHAWKIHASGNCKGAIKSCSVSRKQQEGKSCNGGV